MDFIEQILNALSDSKNSSKKAFNEILNTKTTVFCPGGGREKKYKFKDILRASNLKTSRAEYRFNRKAQREAESALKRMSETIGSKNEERYLKMFLEKFMNIFETAQVVIKKRTYY